MTLGQMLTDLKGMIGPGNYVADGILKGWLNESYLYMCDQISQENPDYFTSSDTADLKANQWEYWLPANCERVIMVNINYGSGWVRAHPLQEINQIPVLADPNTIQLYNVNTPRYYITGGKLGILPMPTANSTDGLKLWFVQVPSELADSDTPLFNSKYHRLLKYGALANYLDQDDQHSAAEATRNRFGQRVQEMVETLAERQQDEPKSIEVVEDADIYADPFMTDGIIV